MQGGGGRGQWLFQAIKAVNNRLGSRFAQRWIAVKNPPFKAIIYKKTTPYNFRFSVDLEAILDELIGSPNVQLV